MTEEYGTPEKKHCNCITTITEALRKAISTKLSEKEDISNLSVGMDLSMVVIEDKMIVTTTTQVNIAYEQKGKWKKNKQYINHSFCPFCGVKKEVSNG